MLIGGSGCRRWTASGATSSPPAAAAPSWPGCRSATSEDADRAVAAARAAFPGWRALHFKDRQKALLRIADALEERAEELALLTAADTGNALRTQARPESQTLVNLFRYFGGVAGEFKGIVLPAGDDQLQYTRREPLGVVAGILPWNSPLMIAGMKTPASLAAGNTLVLKTAQEAPLTILQDGRDRRRVPAAWRAQRGHRRGLADRRGAARRTRTSTRSRSPDPPTIGRHVGEVAGKRLAHVSLELGGKSPNIVFPDAAAPDTIDATAAGVLTAMRFTRQGQSCTAGSRLFVHADVYDDFLAVLVDKVKQLKVGDPLDEATDMGSIINEKQYESVLGYIADGKSPARRAGPARRLRAACRTDWTASTRGRPSSPACDNIVADRAGGDLRTGAGRHPVAGPRRRHRDGQRLALTAWAPTSGRRT